MAYLGARQRYPGVTEDCEIFYDYSTSLPYTRHQQREIERLNWTLKEKTETKKRTLQNLIAYYYQR